MDIVKHLTIRGGESTVKSGMKNSELTKENQEKMRLYN